MLSSGVAAGAEAPTPPGPAAAALLGVSEKRAMPKRGKIAHSLLDLAPNPGAESPAACVRPRCGSRGLSGGARPGSRRPRVRGRPHLPLCLSPSRPTEEGRDLRDALGPGRSEARLRDAQRPGEPPACGRPGPRSPRAEGGSDHSRGPSWAGGGAGTAAGGGGLGGAVLRPRASRGRACGPGPGASARGAAPPQAGPWPAGSAGSRGGAAPRPAGSAVAPVARACPTRLRWRPGTRAPGLCSRRRASKAPSKRRVVERTEHRRARR